MPRSHSRSIGLIDNEVDGGTGDPGGGAKGFRPRLSFVVVEGMGSGLGGLISITGIGVGDGVVCPRLITRKDVELGFYGRRRNATLRHFRGLNEGNIRDGASGTEDARRARGRLACEGAAAPLAWPHVSRVLLGMSCGR